MAHDNLYFNNTIPVGFFLGIGVQGFGNETDLYGDQFAQTGPAKITHSQFDVYIAKNGSVYNHTTPGHSGQSYQFSFPDCAAEHYRPLRLVRDGRNETLEYNQFYNMTYVYDYANFTERGFVNKGYFLMRLNSTTGQAEIYNQAQEEDYHTLIEVSA